MNCDDFAQRMHERLDRRWTLDDDDQLSMHARQCESCRAQMDAWRQIASIMPSAVEVPVNDLRADEEYADEEYADEEYADEEYADEEYADEEYASDVRRAHWRKTIPVLAGLAAVMLFAMIAARDRSETNQTLVAQATDPGPRKTELAPAKDDDMDPALWWRSVQDRDWVGQTMPMVKSVQEGVAPIGRSLMRAVTMLTIGGRDQTS